MKTGDKDTGLMALSPLCDSLSLLISKGHDLDKNESTNFKITYTYLSFDKTGQVALKKKIFWTPYPVFTISPTTSYW